MAGQPRVVIIGGGFAGLHAAKALGRGPLQVTLLDRHNYHLFQPLLYQVATAALSPGEIAAPIRSVLRRYPSVEVRMEEVLSIDLAQRRLVVREGELSYDFLLIAAGVRHSYFGHDEWERFAPGLKSLDDALEMRRRILLAFEAAEKTDDEAEREALLTFAVVGGGPTGVELAGAIAEIARYTVARDFRRIDPARARVVLLEAGPRILPAFDEPLSVKAEASLLEIGVEVRTKTAVTQVSFEGVRLGETMLPARTVLWAAGVAASPLAKSLGVPLDRAGRVVVNAELSIPGHPEVFVVGDLASFEQDGKPLPGLAPVAIQQGAHAARNVLRLVEGKAPLPFRYKDRGLMATVGRASGIVQRGRLRISGLWGWLAWLFVHLLFLIGFKNKLIVMLQWTWSYVTFKRGARLITGSYLPSGHSQAER